MRSWPQLVFLRDIVDLGAPVVLAEGAKVMGTSLLRLIGTRNVASGVEESGVVMVKVDILDLEAR